MMGGVNRRGLTQEQVLAVCKSHSNSDDTHLRMALKLVIPKAAIIPN